MYVHMGYAPAQRDGTSTMGVDVTGYVGYVKDPGLHDPILLDRNMKEVSTDT